MARPTKQGIDYFQADVDMFQDRKIKRLLRSVGSNGFTIYIYLLTCIYRDKGYFYKWDEHSAFDVSDELNFSENAVEEAVRACCAIGLFNKVLFTEKSVLTSESIQDRWHKIVTDANRVDTTIHPQLEIKDGEPLFIRKEKGKSPQETPEKSRESPQSKVKESKVKESTGESARDPSLIAARRPDGEIDLTRINECPVPEEFQYLEFVSQYSKYCDYMEEHHKHRPSSTTTDNDFGVLYRLKQEGHDPVLVIQQTINARNKSFYQLKEFKNNGKTKANQRTDGRYDDVADLSGL